MKPVRLLQTAVVTAGFSILWAGTLEPTWVALPSQAQAGQWQLVNDWPRLPDGVKIGQVSGVDIDTAGHVMVFHRAGGRFDRAATEVRSTATVFELHPRTGELIRSWGAGLFVLPHSLTVDRQNNVWLTDDILHQAMKFSHDGKLLLTIGVPRVPGWDSTHFNEPTDVAVADDGSLYISDGYQNARVAHFRADGSFIKEWGAKGNTDGQFEIPHGIALDASGNVFVADRENARMQVFDRSGKLLFNWPSRETIGRVFDVDASPRGYVYVAVSYPNRPHEIRILDPDWNDAGRILADSSALRVPHQIAVDGDTVLYVADTNGERIRKYARR